MDTLNIYDINSLPNEILDMIFSILALDGHIYYVILQYVCKRWFKIITNSTFSIKILLPDQFYNICSTNYNLFKFLDNKKYFNMYLHDNYKIINDKLNKIKNRIICLIKYCNCKIPTFITLMHDNTFLDFLRLSMTIHFNYISYGKKHEIIANNLYCTTTMYSSSQINQLIGHGIHLSDHFKINNKFNNLSNLVKVTQIYYHNKTKNNNKKNKMYYNVAKKQKYPIKKFF